jgi:two-component system cell cycle response regulator DivK
MPSIEVTAVKPLVLLVDDDEDSRFLYSHYLTSAAGFRVAEAADGQEGIDMASSLRPDVIIMDLTLPVLDGWQALRALKEDERTRSIPVVALTGHSLGEKKDFHAVLLKPCLPEALAAQVKRLLLEL